MVEHGGNIYDFTQEKRDKVLDYSSNINPLNINPSIKKIILKNLDSMNRYPDIKYLDLRKSIGDFNGITYERIVPGNGATEVLFLYCKSEKIKRATIVSPTFGEYERALKTNDIKVDYSYLKEKNKFEIDIKQIIKNDIFIDTELVVLCNPNNPTGRFIPLEQIKKLNEELKKRDIKLFIDECFIEFISGWREMSAVNLQDENIFILRAFTKYFAIPGLRLGYGISFNKDRIENILEIKEPWSINSFAEVVGREIIKESAFIEKTDKWIESEKKWFYEKLVKVNNILPFKTETNFILIKLLNMTSKDFKKEMLKRDVLIRDASNFEGLDDSYIRIAVKTRKNNTKVLNTIMEVIKCQEF